MSASSPEKKEKDGGEQGKNENKPVRSQYTSNGQRYPRPASILVIEVFF